MSKSTTKETGQDRRMAFAKIDFDLVLKARGGWEDFHRTMKIPKPQEPCKECGQ